MKKILLLITAVLISISGFSQGNALSKSERTLQTRSISDGPISKHHLTAAAAQQLQALNHQPRRAGSLQRPATEPKTYALSGYFFTYAGMAYASGLAQQVAIDGDKAYFSNLFPIMLEERTAWTVGNISEDGTKISVPVQHVYDEDWYDIGMDVEFYVGDVVFNEDGEVSEVHPFEFCKDGDYIYIDDLNEIDEEGYAIVNHHIGFFAYEEDAETIALYDYVAGHKLNPFDAGELTTCPAEARIEKYLYTALDDYGDPIKNVFDVAFNGNTVYFGGLTPDQPNWVYGTLDADNTVTIPSGQYVGVNKYFYTYFSALSVAGQDPNGDANFRKLDDLKLKYNPETGEFTFIDKDVFIGELIYQGNKLFSVFAAFGEVNIAPLGEAKPATPSDPYEVFVMDLEDYGYEQWDFGFMLDQEGTQGEYLFPENLKVAMFMDDNLFTFDPEDYLIPESIVFVEYTDADSNDAFYHEKNLFDFYVNKTFNFSRLGAVAIYTVNDETHYSNVAYLDMDTEDVTYVPLTEAQLKQLGANTDAVASIKADAPQNVYYNLLGQRISNAKGIVITNHKKVLVK